MVVALSVDPVAVLRNLADKLYEKSMNPGGNVRQLMVAIMSEFGIDLEDEVLRAIIDKIFQGADVDKDGRIEGVCCAQHPS